jgi:hypothetical protein
MAIAFIAANRQEPRMNKPPFKTPRLDDRLTAFLIGLMIALFVGLAVDLGTGVALAEAPLGGAESALPATAPARA